MAKQFYTERDIEDMAARGVLTLTIGDDVVLTELAFEKAERLGVKLIQPHQLPPSSPVRPYLSEPVNGGVRRSCQSSNSSPKEDEKLRQRIQAAVKAKLGDEVDPDLLDTIITRVLANIGGK
jgi:hypothetical protein